METIKARSITFFVIIAVGLLFLGPTLFPDVFPSGWISRPISLGLDLKGGAHLVYQVVTKEAVRSRIQSQGQSIRADLRDKSKIALARATANDKGQLELVVLRAQDVDRAKSRIEEEYKGLHFVQQTQEGERGRLVYAISEAEIQTISRESVRQAVETLRNRVDQFGVSEPLIQQVGTDRIMLQMPGVQDIESVKRMVGKTAKLEFKLIPIQGSPEAKGHLKDRSGKPIEVEEQVQMTGDAVSDARVGHQEGQVEVSLSLNSVGASTFAKVTGENVNRQLAIILDNVVYSSPVIRERIPGGMASISGGFTFKEASQLAMILRAGALPAPLDVLEERTVGPTLGQDSIRKGMIASAVGLAIIFIFMAIYYGKAGILASASLVLNIFLLLACLSAFGATLTLPGIAGLALTAGMAVDSNVIIFERIRDELRIGATRDAAIRAGFEKAFSAIVDANLTTLTAGIVLYALGSGPIRGFAVTLSIGILTTIYCATFAGRLGFDVFSLKGRKGISI